jgi:hypothetical protein
MTTRERNLDFGHIGPQWSGTITRTLPVAQGRQIILSCTAVGGILTTSVYLEKESGASRVMCKETVLMRPSL